MSEDEHLHGPWELVEDVDEEVSTTYVAYPTHSACANINVSQKIFYLYTRKQQLADKSSATQGLGFVGSTCAVLPIAFTVSEAQRESDTVKSGRNKAKKKKREVNVELELYQDLHHLRHRKGDTG
jgi:hypothetical protein